MSRPLVRVGAALDGESQCKIEQRTKAILPCGIGLDLAANVADDAAKSRAQEFELPRERA